MAGIFRGQGSAIARSLALLPAFLFAVFANAPAMAQLSEQPMLVVDPGMHTGRINAVGVDAAGRFAVTGSHDKTVRVWSLADGKSLRQASPRQLPSRHPGTIAAISPFDTHRHGRFPSPIYVSECKSRFLRRRRAWKRR